MSKKPPEKPQKPKPKPDSFHISIYEEQAQLCGALAHPIRLQILDILGQGEKTPTDLLTILQIPKANVSQHLTVLKEAGILKSRKEGLFHYFSLAIPKIKEACEMVRELLIEKITQEEKENAAMIQELKGKR